MNENNRTSIFNNILNSVGIIVGVIGCLVAIITLVFGENLYERYTGRSLFSEITNTPMSTTPSIQATREEQEPNSPNQLSQTCLEKTVFIEIITKWYEIDPEHPEQAVLELGEQFDLAGGLIGEGWYEAPYTIWQGPTGNVVYWTDTGGQPVQPVDPTGILRDVFVNRGYGIRIAWDTDVIVPTFGRSAWLCERLDPDKDFTWLE